MTKGVWITALGSIALALIGTHPIWAEDDSGTIRVQTGTIVRGPGVRLSADLSADEPSKSNSATPTPSSAAAAGQGQAAPANPAENSGPNAGGQKEGAATNPAETTGPSSGGQKQAEETEETPPVPPTAPAAAPAAAAAPAPAPPPWAIMSLLQGTDARLFLDKTKIKIYGWIEQSFTANPDIAHSRVNGLRVFDDRADEYLLNQNRLTFARAVDQTVRKFQWGFQADFILPGSDARKTISRGLFDHQHALEEIDAPQLFAEVFFPMPFKGLDIKAGKFATPIGLEVIDAPGNPLYSHSYLFGYGIPFTHTGVLTNLNITDRFSVQNGIVEGWDVVADNNRSVTYVGGFNYTSLSKKFNITTAYSFGPEQPNNNSHYRFVIDPVITYNWWANLVQKVDLNYGHEQKVPTDKTFKDANWGGVANYWIYTLNPQTNLVWRTEVFSDSGSRTGFRDTFLENTLGVAYKPRSWLTIRPEVRYDHAFDQKPYDGATDRDLFTAAFDVIINY